MVTWTPLESNPEVQTHYISEKLGVSSNHQIVDVYGLDKDLLEFVPKPVKALILLFPISEKYEAYQKKENEQLEANPPKVPADLFYTKQTVHNACGTIALVHAVLNNVPDITFSEGSILKAYYERTKGLTPDERGKDLESDAAFTQSHEECASEGQTNPCPEEPVYHHFVAFVCKAGSLWELDGRKNFPINHGPSSPGTFLYDAAEVCKAFMARETGDLRFNILALTGGSS